MRLSQAQSAYQSYPRESSSNILRMSKAMDVHLASAEFYMFSLQTVRTPLNCAVGALTRLCRRKKRWAESY